jgi:RNA polymerase sigma-70 factor, ECF subfamily
MKHSDPSNVPPDMEPTPSAINEVDASAVRLGDRVDVEAFVVSAYEAHHAEVFTFLARTTRDRAAAEDLLQETFLRLTMEARDGRAPVHVRGWLFRVATDLVIGRSRHQTTTRRWLGLHRRKEGEAMVAPSPEAGVLGRERATEMERVLEGLSPDARLALLLSGDGFAGHEIAEALDRSAAATRTLLCRARARVRVRRELFAEEAR